MSDKKVDRILHVVLREAAVEGEDQAKPFMGVRSVLMGGVLVAASIFAWRWFGPWAAIGLGVGVTLMRSSFVHAPAKKFRTITQKKRVEMSSAGIKAAADRFIPRAEIVRAYFQPREEERPTLRCLDARGVLVFEAEVADEEEAQELLEALGQDASQARAQFRVAGPFLETNAGWALSSLGAAALFLCALMAGIQGGAIFAVPILALALAAMAFVGRTRRVEVGVDGVLIEWLGRKRFVPFEQIESSTSMLRSVDLRLRDGSLVRLAVPSAKMSEHQASMEVAAMAARIDEANRAHARSAGARELARAVARGERGVAEWRAELERLHDPETRGGYRTPGARGEDLWRVVEDTTAPEDARAGAAMALRKEDGAHPRLRVAAEAVASPKLRVALERAADPATEEAALDEALEAFAAEKS